MATEQDMAKLTYKHGQIAAAVSDPQEKQEWLNKIPSNLNKQGTLDGGLYNKMDIDADNKASLLGLNMKEPPNPQAAPPAPEQAPSYRRGTNFVPRTGLAKLHRGEAVIPRRKAAAMRKRSQFFGE